MKKGLFGISVLTLASLYGVLVAFIILIGLIVGFPIDLILLISIIVLLLQFILAPYFTDLTMKWFYKADFNSGIPDYLKEYLNNLCVQNNMKLPKIGIINDGAPNAFTYGRTKNDARIVLTRGIFELLTEEEVKAVVAHECGHIVHYDMLFMTVAQVVPLVLYYIYIIFADNDRDRDDDEASKFAIIGYMAYVLYIVSQYIILYLSRTREYYADNFSIESTKNPNALASALVKIGYGLTAPTTKEGKMSASKSNTLGIFDAKTSKSLVVTTYDGKAVSTDKIKNAMKWEMWNLWAKVYEFSSTHPLISKRILAISKRSPEFNQNPFIVFDLQQPESYNDDFAKELIICILPWIFLIIWILFIIFDILPIFRGILVPLAVVFSMIKFNMRHKNKDYKNYKVCDLISEVKVSGVTSIPCIIEGTVIGKGDPGYIFDEDFVLKDDTGIIFIDYKHVFQISSFLVGLLKTKKLFGKNVKIKGWYRRSPIPYIEILELQVENEKPKKMRSYIVNKISYIILLILSLLCIFI